jgi:L-lactate dehydrogenase complex protein LldF
VRIPIPDLIRRLRNESYDQDGSAVVEGAGYKKNLAETLVWKGWEWPTARRCSMRSVRAWPERWQPHAQVGPLKKWTRVRTSPQVARTSLHERARKEGVKDE